MSLRVKQDGYDYSNTFELSSLSQFAQAERRVAAKKQALDDMQNELMLIKKQTFEIYKNNIDYFRLDSESSIKQSSKWLDMKKDNLDNDGNKLDGRKSYKEKDIYNYYVDTIKEYLGIDEINDISFINYNFGEATFIKFSYLNHRWELKIPHVKTMKYKSFDIYGANVFKLSISHNDINNKILWENVGSSFEEDDLKLIMAEGIDKYVKKQ